VQITFPTQIKEKNHEYTITKTTTRFYLNRINDRCGDILAAVAIPAYQDYTIKARVGNALTAVDSIKTAVAVCAQENGSLANCNTATAAAGIPTFTPTHEVTSVTVTGSGVIAATLHASNVGTGVNGGTITFTPNLPVGGTSLIWDIQPNATITNAAARAAITKNNGT